MVLRGNGVVWIPSTNQVQQQQQHHEEEADDTLSSWTQNNNHLNQNQNENDNVVLNASTSFKSMLETDWYLNPLNNQHQQEIQNSFIHAGLINNTHQDMREFTSFITNTSDNNNTNNNNNSNSFLLQPMDSSSSCSPSQQCFTSLLNLTTPPTPFDNAFNSGFEPSFLGHYQGGGSGLLDFQAAQLLLLDDTNGESSGFGHVGFEGFDANALFANRVSKGLRPLEGFPQQQQQPTLFQKRAMLRQSSEKLGNLEVSGLRYGGEVGGNWGELERKRKRFELEGEVEEGSFDVSGFNYDSDDRNVESKFEENGRNDGGSNSNANSTVTASGSGPAAGGDQKGKKKGMPAKNLMAERRRRKKLNDRLYMLRSVVPKISKMDRASILGDAIDYLKELLQRINDLHNELESNNPGSMAPPSMNCHPLTPTPSTLPCRVKEELCPSLLPSPKGQPARVEVKLREGRAVNIHMFCSRRPGLLLSTMRALDNLGLDIQQAVISCFNGFALDVFLAEQCSEVQEVLPEQIKAVLLDSAGFHGVM